MSGFEALGLACGVFQTVSFALDAAQICRDIYNGQKSPDSHLEDVAKAMREAADRTKGLGIAVDATPEERRLTDIAEKASGLKEKQGFRELDTDLQSFTWKLASGFTEMNDLLSHESQLIQEHTTKEARRIEKSMIEYAEFQEARQDTKQTTQKQRERILESLRFNDMNQRRNHITDPHDATFDRIFQSYQCVWERPSQSSSGSQIEFDGYDPTLGHQRPDPIDEAWQSFVTWLRSSDELFWIQGKPGLGKSTLVKSIIYGDSAGETTRTHLDEWKPGTRVLSHCFWRIGTSLQSNSRGLYSSLVYQLFENNDALVDHIARRFPFTATKNCLNDWSFKELEKVLKASLEFDQDKSSFCIFVNGLDEYDDDDGQGGVVEKMKMLARYPNVKKRLDQFPHLKLHHLTWDGMKAYALSQFKSLETEEQLTPDLLETLVQKLLSKAQGVFLWLRLAVRSLIDGIEYEDPEDKLFQRLDQLPRELDELYADILIEWDSRMSIQVIRKLLRQGADPVALVSSRDHLGTSKLRPGRKRRECYQIAVRVTALWKAVVSFLLNGFLVCEGKDTVFRYATDVDVVVAMLGACHPRVVDNWRPVAPANFDAGGGWQRLLYDHLTVFHSEYTDRLTPFFEMDICSMLEIGLRHLASIGEPDLVQRAQALRDWIIDPKPPRLRFIRLLPGSLNHHLGAESETNPLFTRWYRVIDQGPFEDIIQFLFYSPRDVDDDSATEARLQKWYRTARNLVYDPNVLQRVSLEEILEAPASEGRHGICSLKDAGFVEDDEMPSSAG
ncbi:hypothetical protein ACO1O0_005918 [Amphichorda felina]